MAGSTAESMAGKMAAHWALKLAVCWAVKRAKTSVAKTVVTMVVCLVGNSVVGTVDIMAANWVQPRVALTASMKADPMVVGWAKKSAASLVEPAAVTKVLRSAVPMAPWSVGK